MSVFDDTVCYLGEGPLWHPERQALFWFDIVNRRLMMRAGETRQDWDFDGTVSAAGWIDRDRLLIASDSALLRFDIGTGRSETVCALEADNAVTRSNDGRADPWGGFWIGTMGKKAEARAGAIWRYYRGELRKLVDEVTISNAISFAPDRSAAYYTDTVRRRIMRQPLSGETGWPEGEAAVFADLRGEGLNPDGAVTDAEGHLWCAMWGAGCVIRFAPDGREIRRLEVAATQPTCPAFGGAELADLYVTSATQGLDPMKEARGHDGATFVIEGVARGLPEPRVIL